MTTFLQHLQDTLTPTPGAKGGANWLWDTLALMFAHDVEDCPHEWTWPGRDPQCRWVLVSRCFNSDDSRWYAYLIAADDRDEALELAGWEASQDVMEAPTWLFDLDSQTAHRITYYARLE